MAGAGLVRGAGGAGGAELNGRSVLQRVLARLHLKRCRPHPHQPPLLSPFSLAGHVGWGSPADHAAGSEECQGYQQEERAYDDWGVASGHEGAEGERPHKGDVDAGQHDAQATGAAQGRRGQALVPQSALLVDLLVSRWSGGFLRQHHVSWRWRSDDLLITELITCKGRSDRGGENTENNLN